MKMRDWSSYKTGSSVEEERFTPCVKAHDVTEVSQLLCRLTLPDRCISVSWGNKSKRASQDLVLLFLLHLKSPHPSAYATCLGLIGIKLVNCRAESSMVVLLQCSPHWNLFCFQWKLPITSGTPDSLFSSFRQLQMKLYCVRWLCLDGEGSKREQCHGRGNLARQGSQLIHSNGNSGEDAHTDFFKAKCDPQGTGTILVQSIC